MTDLDGILDVKTLNSCVLLLTEPPEQCALRCFRLGVPPCFIQKKGDMGGTWVLISEEPAWSMASTTINQAPHPSIPGASSHFQVAEGPRTLESHARLYSETHGYVKVYLRARAVQGGASY